LGGGFEQELQDLAWGQAADQIVKGAVLLSLGAGAVGLPQVVSGKKKENGVSLSTNANLRNSLKTKPPEKSVEKTYETAVNGPRNSFTPATEAVALAEMFGKKVS